CFVFVGCKEETLPKPQSYLRLDYPLPHYEDFQTDCPFSFGKNIYAVAKNRKNCDFVLEYPKMKATVFLSYKPVNDNINELLADAQTFTYRHVVKADNIIEQPYINPDRKVYGMYYEVGGDAASATQFYLTDSIRNFVVGSVYFNAKPNADSLLPASQYLKKDVRLLIESLEWKSY
ncbi:MAG: gliding motility lipoprotein GldD, partial [Flavobacteriaceae bacterium]